MELNMGNIVFADAVFSVKYGARWVAFELDI